MISDHRQLLNEIYQDLDVIWYDESTNDEELITKHVWQDNDTLKWWFMDKQFKRKGQAVKECLKHFKPLLTS